MDKKKIESDLKNYRIRQGYLYKRSKFLKDWRKRWIVLTVNCIYTFTSPKLEELTDVIDLNDIRSYKSYVRKEEFMLPTGFKIRSNDDMFYFSATNTNQKWSWLVTLQRLLDYKVAGSSFYNNYEWVKLKGFDSQLDFQNGGKVTPASMQSHKKLNEEEIRRQAKQQSDRLLQQLQEQQKQLERKQAELNKKELEFQRQKQQQKIKKQSPTKTDNAETKTENMGIKTENSGPPSSPPQVTRYDETQYQGTSKVAQLRKKFQNGG